MALEANSVAAFPAVAADLRRTIDAALPVLQGMSEAEAERPRAPGKWCPKQVLGHLIDSASNNHQRFVRGQQGNELVTHGGADSAEIAAHLAEVQRRTDWLRAFCRATQMQLQAASEAFFQEVDRVAHLPEPLTVPHEELRRSVR